MVPTSSRCSLTPVAALAGCQADAMSPPPPPPDRVDAECLSQRTVVDGGKLFRLTAKVRQEDGRPRSPPMSPGPALTGRWPRWMARHWCRPSRPGARRSSPRGTRVTDRRRDGCSTRWSRNSRRRASCRSRRARVIRRAQAAPNSRDRSGGSHVASTSTATSGLALQRVRIRTSILTPLLLASARMDSRASRAAVPITRRSGPAAVNGGPRVSGVHPPIAVLQKAISIPRRARRPGAVCTCSPRPAS